MIGIIIFFAALLLLFFGYYVAYTFAGVALVVGFIFLGLDLFAFMPYRIMSIMENTVMMAIPMFILMGVILQRSGLAEQLLESMGKLFGGMSGGLAISTILVGTFLAASTGVVGASVVAMGVISLPVMLKHKYDPRLATGTICASGTLGQIVPPSIVLIILGDVMGISVGDLFKAAVVPSLMLVTAYTLYILFVARTQPERCPPVVVTEDKMLILKQALKNIIPTMLLIIGVLGSIFMGIATPTESAAIGAVGAAILSIFFGSFSFSSLIQSSLETVKVTSMVFAVLLGATAFSMVFSYGGGDALIEEFFLSVPGDKWTFIFIAMLSILILGFFIDFIEIAFIVVPLLAPIAELMGINMVWFAILIAMNLQTSFLTPPFGFSLFYLKGVAGDSVKTSTIYQGVMPFIALQVFVLLLVVCFPSTFIFY
ncbi:MAG: tripartite ATP-independent transporter DctM subunit [Arenicella sp.]